MNVVCISGIEGKKKKSVCVADVSLRVEETLKEGKD